MVEDPGAPPLHTLAAAVPLCVLAQLALGAAARHRALGVLPHVIGAAVVTGMILWIVIRVLVRHSDVTPLRRSALAFLTIAISQVFLGIAAYMSRIATADAPQPMALMVGFTVAHVAAGALTMAASVVMAALVFRYVRRPLAEMSPGGVAVVS